MAMSKPQMSDRTQRGSAAMAAAGMTISVGILAPSFVGPAAQQSTDALSLRSHVRSGAQPTTSSAHGLGAEFASACSSSLPLLAHSGRQAGTSAPVAAVGLTAATRPSSVPASALPTWKLWRRRSKGGSGRCSIRSRTEPCAWGRPRSTTCIGPKRRGYSSRPSTSRKDSTSGSTTMSRSRESAARARRSLWRPSKRFPRSTTSPRPSSTTSSVAATMSPRPYRSTPSRPPSTARTSWSARRREAVRRPPSSRPSSRRPCRRRRR
mmetsp:Transcript_94119/g.304501  ORF Transcript_94119/g.304501 Transcript_94119/m.304501 type:complete len:265 (-) Transcript_94119:1212-2006(-)